MIGSTKWQRECVHLAEAVGISDIHIKPGGKHAKLFGRIGDKPVSILLANGTVADAGRSKNNYRAELRRLVRKHAKEISTSTHA